MKNLFKSLIVCFLLLGVFSNSMLAMRSSDDECGSASNCGQCEMAGAPNFCGEDWVCGICQDDSREDLCVLSCGHGFHGECIDFWLHTCFESSNLCPLCKSFHNIRRNLVKLISLLIDNYRGDDPLGPDLEESIKEIAMRSVKIQSQALDVLSENQLYDFYGFMKTCGQKNASSIIQFNPMIQRLFALEFRQVLTREQISFQFYSMLDETLLDQIVRASIVSTNDRLEFLYAEMEKCSAAGNEDAEELRSKLFDFKEEIRIFFEQKRVFREIRRFICESTINTIFLVMTDPDKAREKVQRTQKFMKELDRMLEITQPAQPAQPDQPQGFFRRLRRLFSSAWSWF